MADIRNQLVKDTYNYVLQSDLTTGYVYRIGGDVPVNPIFSSGLTILDNFKYSNGTEQNGYVLYSDGSGNAYWGPMSGSSSGGNFLPLSGGTVTGDTIFTQGLTATTISATTYLNLPNLSGDYLPLSGGTVTGNTIFTQGLTATTISATTYLGLPRDVFVTGGTLLNGTATFRNNTGGTFNVSGFNTATGGTTNYYGTFTDTTTQNVSGANIATVWTYNTTELSNGIFVANNSKITVSNDGIYEIGYSAQIEKTQGGTASDVTIWAKVNGNNIDRSSSTVTLENNTSYQLPFVSYILNLNAGDYVEFYFSSPSDHVRITTLTGLVNPTRPISPSVIIVAKAIGNAVLNNSGDTYVTGFTLSNNVLTLTQNRLGTYSGFSVTLPTDVIVTGGTYSNNNFTFTNNTGGTFSVLFNTVTGLTINGNLSVTGTTSSRIISATTYQNLPVSGLTQGSNISITNNGSGNFTISSTAGGGTFTGGTVTGPTTFINGLSANTISAATYQNLPVTVSAITASNGVSANTSTGNVTIVNSDKGSDQKIFSSIKISGTTQFSASTNTDSINFSGAGINITSGSSNTLIFKPTSSVYSQMRSALNVAMTGSTPTTLATFDINESDLIDGSTIVIQTNWNRTLQAGSASVAVNWYCEIGANRSRISQSTSTANVTFTGQWVLRYFSGQLYLNTVNGSYSNFGNALGTSGGNGIIGNSAVGGVFTINLGGYGTNAGDVVRLWGYTAVLNY